ncbi:MAG: GNAT family N-acetyltransferase [Desulfobaccales bacterium]
MESPVVSLREAGPEDLDRAEALVREAYAEFRPEFSEEIWQKWLDNVSRAVHAPEGVLFLAEVAGELAGVVKFYPDARQSGLGRWPAGAASMRVPAVAPRFRGQGVGSLLVREVLRRARTLGIGTIYLYTGKFMHAARRLYEGLGFVRAPEFEKTPGPLAYRLELED